MEQWVLARVHAGERCIISGAVEKIKCLETSFGYVEENICHELGIRQVCAGWNSLLLITEHQLTFILAALELV